MSPDERICCLIVLCTLTLAVKYKFHQFHHMKLPWEVAKKKCHLQVTPKSALCWQMFKNLNLFLILCSTAACGVMDFFTVLGIFFTSRTNLERNAYTIVVLCFMYDDEATIEVKYFIWYRSIEVHYKWIENTLRVFPVITLYGILDNKNIFLQNHPK